MTDTVLEFRFATYARLPSAEVPTAMGFSPTGIVVTMAKSCIATVASSAAGVPSAWAAAMALTR
jgi:hypothetical protein